jgi:hypothetical protein
VTERELRQKVIDVAKRDLGARQYSEKHAQIIRDFNRIPGMGTWMSTDYAWCAASVSVWGYRAGLEDIFYPSASCNAMINLYKKHGRWMEKDGYVPEIGDVIMYDWDDSGKGDNKGEADHVGIVISVVNGYMTVIEGNKHNAVGVRTLAVGGRYIRGFCLPDYASKADKALPVTVYAKSLQVALNTAYDLNLKVDGYVGPLTKQAIDHHYLWYVKQRPMVNVHVSWLQGCLARLGYDIDVDGSFGPATERTVKKFQKDAGIDVDGYCGVQTHLAILRKLK